MANSYNIPKDMSNVLDMIYKAGNSIILNFEVNPNSNVDIVACALFMKIWHGHIATIRLIEMTLKDEADYIIRTIMETTMILKCLSDDPKKTIKLLASDHRCRKDAFVRAAYCSPHYESITSNTTKPEQKKIVGDKTMGINDWAKLADMTMMYDIPYKLLSNDAHTGIGSLDRYFNFDEQENIVAISYVVNDEDYRRSLDTQIAIMGIALQSMSDIFHIDIDYVIESINGWVESSILQMN